MGSQTREERLPVGELSLVPDNVWSYNGFVCLLLCLYVLYLLLPKAFRKHFCRASRRRYLRRKEFSQPADGYWLPASQAWPSGNMPRVDEADREKGGQHSEVLARKQDHHQGHLEPNFQSREDVNHLRRPKSAVSPLRTPKRVSTDDAHQHVKNTPPSPEHPALKKIPPNKVVAETMGRLQGRGIRLMAHGVQCEPKRVWIRLDDDSTCVTWQTEFPRRVPNQSGEVSIVLMRGSLHRIALCNVLYIDVGKKTKALMRPQNRDVQDTTCFSLLTQNGSLDLQANSKLERDSLVACFSMILDDVHSEDWRALYEASPDPSLATEEGTEVAYYSDLMVEV